MSAGFSPAALISQSYLKGIEIEYGHFLDYFAGELPIVPKRNWNKLAIDGVFGDKTSPNRT